MASRRARILAGLPAYGPLPTAFGSSGVREGLVVEFNARAGRWVGNFARPHASSGYLVESDLHDLGADLVLIIAGGEVYIVDIETRMQIGEHLGLIDAVLVHRDGKITLSDGICLYSVNAKGAVGRTPRISWGGIRALCEVDDVIYGEAYSPMTDDWHEFALSRKSGVISGSIYQADTANVLPIAEDTSFAEVDAFFASVAAKKDS